MDPDRSNGDIERLIGSLSQREQAAVRIMGIDGASAREAAERLGSTEGAVRVAFHRSLKRLTAMAKDKF
ncbi:sigma factor-like helix-turn-helix DNA-binding protein [Neorhizobium turbinariae]|nr:sigma factor-like helix-turn-helix DNA-binding protein [Neorhizobium turbinariae]